MNIDDTVLYPWQLDISLLDSSTFMNGTKGFVTLWQEGTYGYGGSSVVLEQISKTLDERVDALAAKMAH
jgi:hypothetical protein